MEADASSVKRDEPPAKVTKFRVSTHSLLMEYCLIKSFITECHVY